MRLLLLEVWPLPKCVTEKARVTPSTAESYMFTVRSFFNWCIAESLCRRNPALQVQLDRIDRKGRTHFGDLELPQHLIENAPRRPSFRVVPCFHTGMRKLEIVEAVSEWFEGVPWISPHVMRHPFASICASKGIDRTQLVRSEFAHVE